jgi:hypothetical protein
MVEGLFPQAEQPIVLATLEKATVFLTAENVEQVLRQARGLRTAWDLANLYLNSVDAPLLGEDAPRIVGLSAHTTFYVSALYFEEDEPFDDFVVHEAAHVFHNCKRGTLGLPEKRRAPWLLMIDFRHRELFAYACEAYSRIVSRARNRRERLALAAEYGELLPVSVAAGTDGAAIAEVVLDAAGARQGWKRILARCAPAPRPRVALASAANP